MLDMEEVRIKEVKPNGIRVTHKWGGRFIPINEIPAEIKADLGMTKEKEEAFREQKKQEGQVKQLAMKAAKQQVSLQGEVLQVLDGGLLITNAFERVRSKKKVKFRTPYKVKTGGPTGLHPKRRYTYITRYKDEWKYTYETRRFGMIFVKCSSVGYVDGQDFAATVYPFGTYTYTSVAGAKKTVERVTLDAVEFLKAEGEL